MESTRKFETEANVHSDSEPGHGSKLPGSTESMGSVAREVADKFKDLVRSEMELAKVEMKDAAGQLQSHVSQIAVFGAIAALGVLPFMAFLVIGLGNVFGGRYWLSSLTIAALCFGVGAPMVLRALRALRSNKEFLLPRTRRRVEEGIGTVNHKVREISDSTKRRVA